MNNKSEGLTRRDFLKLSALWAGGILAISCSLPLSKKSGRVINLPIGKGINQRLFYIEKRDEKRIIGGKETTHTTYNLAYNAKSINDNNWKRHIFYSHPSENEMKKECPSGWFVNQTSCLNPFSEDTPELIKFIYSRFGNDSALKLIRYRPFSNSARLIFPEHLEDEPFHEEKLSLLTSEVYNI